MIPKPPAPEAAAPAPADGPAPATAPPAAIPFLSERPAGPMLAVAALFIGIYASTFWFMMKRWTTDPAATHGWLVLPIIAWVIWEKRDKLKTLPVGTHKAGLWTMGLALFLHLAEKAIDLNGPSPLSIPIFVGGAVWYFLGTQWLKELIFPIGYMTFMIPIPGGLTEVVSFPLRLLATNGSRAIVHQFGIEVYGSGMHMEFFQPRGYEYIRLEVADPCSGLHSLMAIKALHAITAYKTRLKLGWKWFLFMCAIPVSLAANLCRMVSIILVAGYINKKFGLEMWHENIAPYLLFGFAFIILISLGRFMEWITGALRDEKIAKAAAAAEPPADVVTGPRPTLDGGVPAAAPSTSRRRPNYAAVGALMAAAFALTMFFTFRGENSSAPIADVKAIPKDLGDWKFYQDTPIDANVMKQMLADSYVSRVYVNPKTRQMVELLVVYRRYGRREFSHRPELCYPAGGYTIVKKDRTTLPYAGQERPAVHLLADGSKVQLTNGATGVPPTTISYLFASGDRTECDFLKQQIWMALERIIPNKNGWTFVRLSSMRQTTDDEALAGQRDFMTTYGPDIQRVITTHGEPKVTTASAAAPSTTEAFGTFK